MNNTSHCLPRVAATLGVIILLLAPLIPPAAAQQDVHFQYLQGVFDSRDKDLISFIIRENESFLALYPEGENAARVQSFLATLYQERGWEHQAVAAQLRVAMVFPASTLAAAAKENCRNRVIRERRFRRVREAYVRVLSDDYTEGSHEDKAYLHLQALYAIQDSEIYDFILTQTRDFLTRYPANANRDLLLRQMGEIHESDDQHKYAVAMYLQVVQRFPSSLHVPFARLHRAQLFYRELHNVGGAVQALTDLLRDAPGAAEAPTAQFLLGEISEREVKRYELAVEHYKKVVAAYPDADIGMDALFRAAELEDRRLKQYPAAIATYHQLANHFTEREGAERALELAAKVYEDDLKDYDRAIGEYLRMAELFPTHPRVPERLMNAGKLAKDRLRDYPRAIEIFRQVTTEYAMSDEARKAVDEIRDCEERQAREQQQ